MASNIACIELKLSVVLVVLEYIKRMLYILVKVL